VVGEPHEIGDVISIILFNVLKRHLDISDECVVRRVFRLLLCQSVLEIKARVEEKLGVGLRTKRTNNKERD